MKRISILSIFLLVTMCSVSQGRHYCSIRYRTRWSVYRQGLISGDLYYSPYAFQYGNDGLVPGNVRYSPYAFDYEHSGLVYDPWCRMSTSLNPIYYDINRNSDYNNHKRQKSSCASYCESSNSFNEAKVSYQEKMEVRKANIRKLAESRSQSAAERREDGDMIVSRYLKSKNIEYQLNNYLRIDGRTVSVNFLLKDKNIIIKYWDPEQIDLLESKVEYKQLNYVRYLQEWNNFRSRYLQAGGKVCQIISADGNEIISKLERSGELVGG